MLDPAGREQWFQAFFAGARRHSDRSVSLAKLERWARSMSLIAEQFADNRWAAHQCELLGLRPDDPFYAEALKLAERPLCAWQVAVIMQASPDVVISLGGHP